MKKPLAILTVIILYCSVIQTNKYRLPNTVIPYFYNITTDVYIDMLYFKGITEIQVDVVTETDNITLHALDLNISDVCVFRGEETIGIESTNYQEDSQFLIITCKEKLKIGKYKLWIQYDGRLNKDLVGFYYTNYTAIDFLPRNVAVTHFEPIDARRAFPCFDEPAYKANFSITIINPTGHIALSNMPLRDSDVILKSYRVRNTFETTPKISTYIVALAVCDYSNISYSRGHIYTRDSYKDWANFTASVLSSIIETTENYLKMDNNVDGMENLGLILLLERSGLYKEGENTLEEKYDTFNLIIHETVHHWFGNLVTCNWWNDLWLQEGVTAFLESRIAEKIMPQWRSREQAIIYWIKIAVEIDQSENARSLSQEAEQPNNYTHDIGLLPYTKAAAVLLTLENILEEKYFKRGLQIYLKKHKYSTATGKDFWDAFQNSIELTNFTEILPRNTDLVTIMQSWEKQVGVPVLNVTRTYSPSSVQFSQKRFVLKKQKNLTEWYIPINIATKSKPDFEDLTPVAWLKPTRHLVLYQFVKSEDWLIVNKQASFYYLVNYDEKNWKLIASALQSKNFGNIPSLTRAKLLFDAFKLALSGQLKFSVALQLIKYIDKERDYIALNSFLYGFELFYTKFCELKNFHHLQVFISNALQPTIEHLGFEENKTLTNDAQLIDTLNRIQVIKWACLLGNQLCRKATANRFIKGVDTISVDLRQVIICGSLRESGVSLWKTIFEMTVRDGEFFENEALGCSEDKNNLDIYVEIALQYNYSVFYRIYPRGSFGTNYALEYLVKHWNKVNESLSEENIIGIITGLALRLTTHEQLAKLKSIVPHLTTPEIKDAFKKAIFKVHRAVRWVNFYAADITQWITKELENVGADVRVSICVIFVVLINNFNYLC